MLNTLLCIDQYLYVAELKLSELQLYIFYWVNIGAAQESSQLSKKNDSLSSFSAHL